ncbi:HaeII family restriction endonuclease [Anabaena sp. FACHB-1237]|uniref:HaeII family restriction endonuclease n=1 Tax=Anabaena sp. FACHB-1237 TaxID=2692769 RepID=UPI0016803D1D|nr:HaeII family restriction endonuclease [Anabaena sp. FACHB-1237]MBD2138762.1 HaeII family restriction endonuclease [Anabaena sp. FACHB-1237]
MYTIQEVKKQLDMLIKKARVDMYKLCQSKLIHWYDLCLRGQYSQILSRPLVNCLSDSFRKEFPHSIALTEFLAERNYPPLDKLSDNWQILG